MKMPVSAGDRSDKSDIPVAREEWDFSKCPQGEIEKCEREEYRREAIRIWLSKNPSKKAYIPVPYLRNAACKLNHSPSPEYSAEFRELFRQIHPKDLLPRSFEIIKISISDCQLIPEFKGRRPPIDGYAEFMGLRIDWSYPDLALIKAFELWLWDHRPIPPVKQTGKSPSRKSKANLRALGAYRLMSVLTAGKAVDLTKKLTGRPLFAKIPDWYKAGSQAKKLLEPLVAKMKAPPEKAPTFPELGKRLKPSKKAGSI